MVEGELKTLMGEFCFSVMIPLTPPQFCYRLVVFVNGTCRILLWIEGSGKRSLLSRFFDTSCYELIVMVLQVDFTELGVFVLLFNFCRAFVRLYLEFAD